MKGVEDGVRGDSLLPTYVVIFGLVYKLSSDFDYSLAS